MKTLGRAVISSFLFRFRNYALPRPLSTTTMAPPPPEVIDLSSSSDEDDDDLKRAIALSLKEAGASAKSPVKPDSPAKSPFKKEAQEDSNIPKNEAQPLDSPAAPGMTAFGSMLLDRKKMEEERQARIAKRKRAEDGSSEEAPAAQKPRVKLEASSTAQESKPLVSRTDSASSTASSSESPAPQKPRVSHEASTRGSTAREYKPSIPSAGNTSSTTAPSAHLLPFRKGAVRRTWTSGCERKGDDIKIEEVFQKDQLKLAVLASYQWDDEWMLSKIDISRTRLVCVAFAKDEAHVGTAPPFLCRESLLTPFAERPDAGQRTVEKRQVLLSAHERPRRHARKDPAPQVPALHARRSSVWELDALRLGRDWRA